MPIQFSQCSFTPEPRSLSGLFLSIKNDLLHLHRIEELIPLDCLTERHNVLRHKTSHTGQSSLFKKKQSVSGLPEYILLFLKQFEGLGEDTYIVILSYVTHFMGYSTYTKQRRVLTPHWASPHLNLEIFSVCLISGPLDSTPEVSYCYFKRDL